MKTKLAYTKQGLISVLENDAGELFYIIPNTSFKLPFVITDEVKLIDVPNTTQLAAKFQLLEMKVKSLEKRVAENYSSQYLDKYFSELSIEYPDFEIINKIVTKYSNFLHETFSNSIWSKKRDEVNSSDMTSIEKDVAHMKIFMEYIKTT